MYKPSVFLLTMKLSLQHANNVLSDSPGLVDSLLPLPNGQVVSWENFLGIQLAWIITVICSCLYRARENEFQASTCTLYFIVTAFLESKLHNIHHPQLNYMCIKAVEHSLTQMAITCCTVVPGTWILINNVVSKALNFPSSIISC